MKSKHTLSACIASLGLLWSIGASAQVPTSLNPSGTTAAPAAAQPQPVVIPVPAAAPVVQGEGNVEGDGGGFYHTDSLQRRAGAPEDSIGSMGGPVPEVHQVRSGDTLWDLCLSYFDNPWDWPKVWSYNPTIKDPNLIYPGDKVRLYPQGLGPAGPPMAAVEAGAGEGALSEGSSLPPAPSRRFGVGLRQLAFVSKQDLDYSAAVHSSPQEKIMLSTGDMVHLKSAQAAALEPGKRYAVYTDPKTVRHPSSGDNIGSYVRIVGELEVVSNREGELARAVITDSNGVIERGARVGPLRRTFRTVQPQRNKVDAEGTVVAMLTAEALIGSGDVVFLDRGASHGVEVGNRMYVVRRADGQGTRLNGNVGRNDGRFPPQAVGEVLVVQAGKSMSVGLVTLSTSELGVGDRVVMRKSK